MSEHVEAEPGERGQARGKVLTPNAALARHSGVVQDTGWRRVGDEDIDVR